MPRLRIVACSPRIPPGTLSWPAWQALHEGPVLFGDADHPQLPYLAAAGIFCASGSLDDLPDHDVVWLSGGEDVRAVAGRSFEVVYGSVDPPGARLLDVVAVMDRLRSEGGCPWDAKQTHTSLMPYLLEEAYETYEALETGDLTHLREELGDLLLQVYFHAVVAEESGAFSLDDVARDITEKMVRRNPHVFGDAADPATPGDAASVNEAWEAIKATEKARTEVTDGLPPTLPALLYADKVLDRLARRGTAVEPDGDEPGDDLGDRLLALVAEARETGTDPEQALRDAVRRVVAQARPNV